MSDEIEEREEEGEESVRLTVAIEKRVTVKVSEKWKVRHEERMKTVRVGREGGGEVERKREREEVSSISTDIPIVSQPVEQSQRLGDGWEW